MESIFSPSWYRVASLQPQLRKHAEINRHHYREKLWYVLHDRISGRFHRLTPEAHYVVAQMNGDNTFQEIWDKALEYLGDDAPNQEEMIQLLGQLHSSDLLLCDISPDCGELFERYERHQKQKLKQRFWSPLAQRFPLFDPEMFLQRWLFLVKPIFGWTGVVVWLIIVFSAAILSFSHWDDLTHNISDRVLAPDNLIILFLVYPIIKALHEFGHGFATKVWGGEVHEMGIMLLVFMPVPYVDASSASAFREKSRRMVVGAAGIMVELLLASMAMFFWVSAEPGMLRAIAFNIVLIGSVSTLFFNGNPLLRFDGYYVFADAIEIPNLSSRANKYLGYLVQKYLFGIARLSSPVSAVGEKFWFVLYGIAAFCYRIFIVFSIVLFVAGKFFVIGVILAIWAGLTTILMPIGKGIQFLLTNSMIGSHRVRAVFSSTLVLTIILGFLLLMPIPLATRAEGVVWPPEDAYVRAKTSGFIERIMIEGNSPVKKGDLLIKMQASFLTAERKILEYQVLGLQIQFNAALREDLIQAQVIQEELVSVTAKLKRVQERNEQLLILSQADGIFVLPKADDLPQRWVSQGEVIAYVVKFPISRVRAVVSQDSIGLVRQRTESVAVKFVEHQIPTYSAKILYEVPAASNKLPSAALGQVGGGEIPIDPSAEGGAKTFETVFQFDLQVNKGGAIKNIGERVYIRFDHGTEPLAYQWYRKLRQLFLRRFSV